LEAERVERKLSAIFAADVEGYSRLMGLDEVGTLRTLTAYRVIIDRLIAAHRGRIFNTAGYRCKPFGLVGPKRCTFTPSRLKRVSASVKSTVPCSSLYAIRRVRSPSSSHPLTSKNRFCNSTRNSGLPNYLKTSFGDVGTSARSLCGTPGNPE
jgi:hypothetical protein